MRSNLFIDPDRCKEEDNQQGEPEQSFDPARSVFQNRDKNDRYQEYCRQFIPNS